MSERRIAWVLLLLLVAQLLLIASQVSAEGGDSTLLEELALWLVAPMARGVGAGLDGASDMLSNLRQQRRVVAENRELEGEVKELQMELLRLQGIEQERDRLAAALEYSQRFAGRLRVADLVYSDVTSEKRTLVLHGGPESSRVNEPVLSQAGLVGRVILRVGSYLKVQLITDRAAVVGAMVQRSRRQGLVRGLGEGGLELAFIPVQADVRPGDLVVTSGIDGIYPRYIPVGEVVSVEPGEDLLFHKILLRPAVDFQVLDQVYVLETEPLPSEIRQEKLVARP